MRQDAVKGGALSITLDGRRRLRQINHADHTNTPKVLFIEMNRPQRQRLIDRGEMFLRHKKRGDGGKQDHSQ